MKKFIAIYHAPAEALAQSANATEKQKAEGMNRWFEWKAKNNEAVVDFGAPLGNGQAIAKGGNFSQSSKEVCGFSILQGESESEVRSRFNDHPHLDWHPQASVELHEVLPM